MGKYIALCPNLGLFNQCCGSEIIFSDPDPTLTLISDPDSDPDPACL